MPRSHHGGRGRNAVSRRSEGAAEEVLNVLHTATMQAQGDRQGSARADADEPNGETHSEQIAAGSARYEWITHIGSRNSQRYWRMVLLLQVLILLPALYARQRIEQVAINFHNISGVNVTSSASGCLHYGYMDWLRLEEMLAAFGIVAEVFYLLTTRCTDWLDVAAAADDDDNGDDDNEPGRMTTKKRIPVLYLGTMCLWCFCTVLSKFTGIFIIWDEQESANSDMLSHECMDVVQLVTMGVCIAGLSWNIILWRSLYGRTKVKASDEAAAARRHVQNMYWVWTTFHLILLVPQLSIVLHYGRRKVLGAECRGDIQTWLWLEIWMCSLWGLLTLDLPCFRKSKMCSPSGRVFFLLFLTFCEVAVQIVAVFILHRTALSRESNFVSKTAWFSSQNLDCQRNYEMLYISSCTFFGLFIIIILASAKSPTRVINSIREIFTNRDHDHDGKPACCCCCSGKFWAKVGDNVHREYNGPAVLLLIPSVLHSVVFLLPNTIVLVVSTRTKVTAREYCSSDADNLLSRDLALSAVNLVLMAGARIMERQRDLYMYRTVLFFALLGSLGEGFAQIYSSYGLATTGRCPFDDTLYTMTITSTTSFFIIWLLSCILVIRQLGLRKGSGGRTLSALRIDPIFWERLGIDTAYHTLLDVASVRRNRSEPTIIEKGIGVFNEMSYMHAFIPFCVFGPLFTAVIASENEPLELQRNSLMLNETFNSTQIMAKDCVYLLFWARVNLALSVWTIMFGFLLNLVVRLYAPWPKIQWLHTFILPLCHTAWCLHGILLSDGGDGCTPLSPDLTPNSKRLWSWVGISTLLQLIMAFSCDVISSVLRGSKVVCGMYSALSELSKKRKSIRDGSGHVSASAMNHEEGPHSRRGSQIDGDPRALHLANLLNVRYRVALAALVQHNGDVNAAASALITNIEDRSSAAPPPPQPAPEDAIAAAARTMDSTDLSEVASVEDSGDPVFSVWFDPHETGRHGKRKTSVKMHRVGKEINYIHRIARLWNLQPILVQQLIRLRYEETYAKKIITFRKRMQTLLIDPSKGGAIKVHVDRANIFESAFESFMKLPKSSLYRHMHFQFAGEEGLDAGGLSREFFGLITEAIFSKERGMFQYVTASSGQGAYIIDPTSQTLPDWKKKFYFVGKILGKAMLDGQTISAYLSNPLIKIILAQPILIDDLRHVDKEMAESFAWMLKNDGAAALFLDFSVMSENGDGSAVQLIPNGSAVEVDDSNKRAYMSLYLKYRLYGAVKHQIEHLLCGFYEVVALPYVSFFNCREFELLLCGMPTISVDDWRLHTVYRGCFNDHHHVISWFWTVLKEFDEEKRAKFLQFATGTSRLPVGGFKALSSYGGRPSPFTIDPIPEQQRYPRSHTCFNRIDLPIYSSCESMKEALELVLTLEMRFDAE